MAPTWPKPTRGNGNNGSSSSSSSSRASSSSLSNPGPIAVSSDDDPIALSDDDEDDNQGQAAHPIAMSSDDEDGNQAAPPIAMSDDDDSQAAGSGERAPLTRKIWLFRDEFLLLNELATKRRESGKLPGASAVREALSGHLKRENVTTQDLTNKIQSLMKKFEKAIKSGGPGEDTRDRRLYELSVEVWPELLP